MTRSVTLVPTGIANVASVSAAFQRLGARVQIADTADDIEEAGRVVLPGVGAFGPAMESLAQGGFDARLRRRVDDRRPTLAVCLGLQLLGRGSEESPGVRGLGVLANTASRFDGDLRVPHLGWNRVHAATGCSLLTDGWAYFAHSFRLTGERLDGDDWTAAHCDYGGRFIAACERGPVLACQFHPELSGEYGRQLLERWLTC